MKKEAVGNITRSGGFSRLVRDVEESGEPIVIMKSNASVAVLMPCPEGMMSYLQDWVGIVHSFNDLLKEGRASDGFEFLLKQALLGNTAQTMLLALNVDSADIDEVIHTANVGVAKVARSYGERVVVSEIQSQVVMRYSSGEGGSVQPMTTTRTDVSEVKNEGLDSSPSLPRKRGRPRKT
jgi:antitoxin (DNA-binding transcriptional repressor) of toxin-antitoxin stability system